MAKASVIIDDFIAVDYFGRSPSIKYYFLTHAHADHCCGLNDRWNHAPIYCTEETAQILPVITARKPQLRGIDERWITIIEVNVRKKMDGFWVTPLNANHIRGAVMYLFEGPAIKEVSVLCTGDFRADTHFYAQPSTILLLQEHIFGMIHVDNTYSESLEKEFPSREESLEEAVKVIRSLPNDANIYLVMNRVGREQFLLDLSERLQERIALHKWRQAIADAWELSDHFAKPDEETRIRTCRREETRALLQNENAYVIEVTMLASLKADVSVIHDRVRTIDYSDHCSPNELRDFLSLLKFRDLAGCAGTLRVARRCEYLLLSLLRNGESANRVDKSGRNDDWETRDEFEPTVLYRPSDPSTIKRNSLALDALFKSLILPSANLVDGHEIVVEENTEQEDPVTSLERKLRIENIVANVLSGIDQGEGSSDDPVSQRENDIMCLINAMPDDDFKLYGIANSTDVEAPKNVKSNAAQMVEFVANDGPLRVNEVLREVCDRTLREVNADSA